MLPAYDRPIRVGVSSHLTLWMPSPSTISIGSARLLYTTTSSVCPVSDTRTLIFSGSIGLRLRFFEQLLEPPVGAQPDRGDQHVQAARDPGLHEGERNRGDVNHERDLSL